MNRQHLDTWELEQAWEGGDAGHVGDMPSAWACFVAEVERLLGIERSEGHHGLDGDEGDGMSLASAYEAFRTGLTPEQYVSGRAKREAPPTPHSPLPTPHLLLPNGAGVMLLGPKPGHPPLALWLTALASFASSLVTAVAICLVLIAARLP